MGRDPRAIQTRVDIVKEDGEVDEDTGNEERKQDNLLTLTDEDYRFLLDDDVDFSSQPSTTRQGQNDSMMSDVHPNLL